MNRDLELLQGTWSVETLQVDDQPMSAEVLGDAHVVIAGQRFTSTGMGVVYEGTIELDASATPAHIDMKFDGGPEKGNTNLGIYQLEGDAWKLCLATRGTVRPTEFGAPAGTGIALETLVRGGKEKARPAKKSAATAAPPAPALSDAPTEFEGDWAMLSGVMDGKAMDASLLPWVKRNTRGDQTTVMAGPQTQVKVTFTFDASQSPKAIDYVNLAGANKGKSQQGIYKLEGDVLTVCIAPPGAPRPAEFASSPGDKRTLTSWKRS